MATFLKTIQIGDKKYHLSQSGQDVYYSTSNKTGGLTLKGVKYKNNQLLGSDNKELTDFQIGQAITASNNSGGGFCFISTVVYNTINRDDKCYELELLRNFRDDYLLKDDDYAKLVDEYYQIAPPIAQKLENYHDKNIYQEILSKYLDKVINCIEMKDFDNAVSIYQDMVDFLDKKLTI